MATVVLNGAADPAIVARAIIDANLYLTLGTADREGRPWVSPVFYACADYTEFYWISAPEAMHSRNIAVRPRVSIVVFDSQVPAGTGQGVYMSAVVDEPTGAELDRGLEIYPGAVERGGRRVTPEQVLPPAPYRFYRATVSEHSVICPDPGQPCPVHATSGEHRTLVHLRSS
jgi:hypothetical protein